MVRPRCVAAAVMLMVVLAVADDSQPSATTKKKKSKPTAATTGSTTPHAKQPAAPAAAPVQPGGEARAANPQSSTTTKKKKLKQTAATSSSTTPHAAQPAAPAAAPAAVQPVVPQDHKKKKQKKPSAEAHSQPAADTQAAGTASQAPAPLSSFLAALSDEKKKSLTEMLKNLRDARKLPSEQRKPAMQSIDKSIHELLGNDGYKSWRADMQAKDKERKAKAAPGEQASLTSPISAAPTPKKSSGMSKSQGPPSATSAGALKPKSGTKRKLATAESVPLPAVEAAAQKKTKKSKRATE